MIILGIILWFIIGAASVIVLLSKDYRGKNYDDIKDNMDFDFWFWLLLSSMAGVLSLITITLMCMFEAEIPQKFLYKIMNIGVKNNDSR